MIEYGAINSLSTQAARRSRETRSLGANQLVAFSACIIFESFTSGTAEGDTRSISPISYSPAALHVPIAPCGISEMRDVDSTDSHHTKTVKDKGRSDSEQEANFPRLLRYPFAIIFITS